MTVERMAELFEYRERVHCGFDAIKNKRSNRPDLHAFLLLDELVPGCADIISSVDFDTCWLSIDAWSLAVVVDETRIDELVRCGVRYTPGKGMWMFV